MKIFKRLLSLLCIQLCIIILCFICGLIISNSFNDSWIEGNVKFISKTNEASHKVYHTYQTPTYLKISKKHCFSDYFRENRYITSKNDLDTKSLKICFKEGVEEEDNDAEQRALKFVNNETEYENDNTACKCKPGWHGQHCSEPEIIWRAFMTSRQIMSQTPKITRKPNNIFYIINDVTNIILETLEIQMLELIDTVNLFILCDKIISTDPTLSIRQYMNKGFLLRYQQQILLIRDEECNGASIFRQMKKILRSQIQLLDVIVYSKGDEILNRKAINYLKWHNYWHQPLRFRLKWNVYGFFFQHPEHTVTRSIACQFNVLEQFYRSDIDLMIASSKNMLIVGDLNHYGGWFCEYCHQPLDIIRKFHLDSKILGNKSSNIFQSLYHKTSTIDIAFVENLINYGLYIDGKLQLLKYHNYHDTKYFTPESVAKYSWKFSNIMTNFYSSWNDDNEY